jgi:beta-galactosidase
MVRLYGHTMPVRWGQPGEKKTIRVYSNCPQAELFVDGVSQGVKRRDSRDFPCAGLRWEVALAAGVHRVRVIAEKDGVTVADELEFTYQTEAWGAPAKLELRELSRERVGELGREIGERDGEHDQALAGERLVVTVEAAVYDANGVFCPDAADIVRFGFAGDGKLLDNLGTVGGSRLRQLANGRAHISAELPPDGAAVVSVSAAGLSAAFLAVK